jgi:amino acid adenylation domain-containing protein/non-ribosomal peptide synthase protein (TIGR01720 family)
MSEATQKQAALAWEGMRLLSGEERTNYPLTVSIDDMGEGFAISAQCVDGIDASRIAKYLIQAIKGIAKALEQDRHRPTTTIDILPEAERQQLLVEWNATQAPYSQDRCIHELFEEQVAKTPEHVAVVFEEQSLTYRGLNAQANRLAHYLREQGVGPGNLVGLCMKRSLEMMVGVLGILKAGGAYVPLDPGYPPERLAYMLGDAKPALALTQSSLVARLPASQSLFVLDQQQALLARQPDHNPEVINTPQDLLYVIYTSGSTGIPKGVMIEHQGAVNLGRYLQDRFSVTAESRVLGYASMSFDMAVWDWLMALLHGASLYVASEGQRHDLQELQALLVQSQITHAILPPALVRHFNVHSAFGLETLILGGDAVTDVFTLPGAMNCRIFNAYGPTEATVCASAGQMQAGTPVTIGRPVSNYQLYVLDGQQQLVPIGVAGELYIGGVGLARGYLNQPEWTAERFIANPFFDPAHPGSSERLYRTGDLVRYLEDGNLEYLRRIDDQVKIRGVRIELGEIEHALGMHEDLSAAVVLAREDVPGEKRLVAYVVAKGDAGADWPAQLKAHLQTSLPEYMVPAWFVMLDALPLTPNGKIDRKALPVPDMNAQQGEYVAPQTETERLLVSIWSELLQVPAETIGAAADFFALGGHSLLVIRLVSEARRKGYPLVAKDLMLNTTLSKLAAYLDQHKNPSEVEDLHVEGQEIFSLPNKGLLLKNENEHHWNISMMLEVHKVNSLQLEHALKLILEENEGLRHCFHRNENGVIYEKISAVPENGVLDVVDLSHEPVELQSAKIEYLSNEYQASLEFSRRLYRFIYFDLGKGRPGRFVFIIHHGVFDGYSSILFLRSLHDKLFAFDRNAMPAALPPTTTVRQWGKFLHQHANGENAQEEFRYWTALPWNKCSNVMDFPEGLAANKSGNRALYGTEHNVIEYVGQIDSGFLLEITKSVNRHSVADIVLTALAAAIARHTENGIICFDLISNGRTPVFREIDLSRTMGWLADNVPILIQFGEDDDVEGRLSSFQRQFRDMPSSGVGFNALRHMSDDKNIRKRMLEIPIPEILVNYLPDVLNQIEVGDEEAQNADFSYLRIAKESPGLTEPPADRGLHRASCATIQVIDGKFTLMWSFRDNVYKRETIEILASRWRREMEEIATYYRLHYCMGSGEIIQ